MRLIKAEFYGFGRLAEGVVNLDNKVVAIVGPNEAGKTTLLRGLAYISNGATLSASERSRGASVPDDQVVVRTRYVIDSGDLEALAAFDLEEPPQTFLIARTAGAGDARTGTVPVARKALAPLLSAAAALQKAATTKAYAELDYDGPEQLEDGSDGPVDEAHSAIRPRAEEVIGGFGAALESQAAESAADDWAERLEEVADSLEAYGLGRDLAVHLRAVIGWVDQEDPSAGVREILARRAPELLLFGDADRMLGSLHGLSAEFVTAPPASLSNLASMAGLDLRALWATYEAQDEGERDTLVERANQALAAKFDRIWNQSRITVVLKTEGSTLSVRVKQNGNRITQFDERSAGLKMFVALAAFLDAHGTTVPPVLLIDEAETHLHVDAQADLVNTFMSQEQAAKIIYTTHSPACLPPDLGSNIRAVVPDTDHEYRSVIKGSFWERAAGFSPLMLAMGAGAAAFSTARYVVLAEGASEMLLLPSLLKAALGVADLSYQIAPGLSEVPPEMYPELDLAGARVAYLVDGDKGGLDRRKALVAGGVPDDQIVTLGALTLENLLDPAAYKKVLRELLSECNPGKAIPDFPVLPDPGESVWPKYLEGWAEASELSMPGKRVVASRLVEERSAAPSNFGKPILLVAHQMIRSVLRRGAIGEQS